MIFVSRCPHVHCIPVIFGISFIQTHTLFPANRAPFIPSGVRPRLVGLHSRIWKHLYHQHDTTSTPHQQITMSIHEPKLVSTSLLEANETFVLFHHPNNHCDFPVFVALKKRLQKATTRMTTLRQEKSVDSFSLMFEAQLRMYQIRGTCHFDRWKKHGSNDSHGISFEKKTYRAYGVTTSEF